MPEHKMITVDGIRYRREDAPETGRHRADGPVAPVVEPEAAAPVASTSTRKARGKGGAGAGNGD